MPLSRSASFPLSAKGVSRVYALLAFALAMTCAGIFLAVAFAPVLMRSGLLGLFLILELVLIFTARLWSRSAPMNIVLFALFPLFSGITLTPYILSVVATYVNGVSILLNAVLSTVCMGLAAAVLSRTAGVNLAGIGNMLFLGLLGLLALAVLQIFFPALRTEGIELLSSGIGIGLFAAFLAFDMQRLSAMHPHSSPFELALSLYLDIFNLFLSILRFMVAMSGRRR